MGKSIRLLIADNDLDFIDRVQTFLGSQADINVVDVVRDGWGAINRCKETLPDLVLMDLHLPVLDSIKAIRSIVEQNERIRILVTSTIPDDRYALEAVKVGAYGYVNKGDEVDYDLIADSIRRVAKGEVLVNQALAISILSEFQRLTGLPEKTEDFGEFISKV